MSAGAGEMVSIPGINDGRISFFMWRDMAHDDERLYVFSACCVLSCFSCVRPFATQWTVAHQAPLSKGFSRQEYWSGLPCPPPGDLPNPRINPASLMSPPLASGFFTTRATWEALSLLIGELFSWSGGLRQTT